jgi:hypothetical protein
MDAMNVNGAVGKDSVVNVEGDEGTAESVDVRMEYMLEAEIIPLLVAAAPEELGGAPIVSLDALLIVRCARLEGSVSGLKE